jgi:subfamily B ATP-binding cassette protein MsbA
MQFALSRHLLTLSMRFFDRQRVGALISRLETDTTAAAFGIHVILARLTTAPVLILFYGFLLVRTSPLLAIAAVIVAAIHFGITRGITGPIRRSLNDQFSAIADLSARFQEILLNIRIVKSFVAEAFELSRLRKEIEAVVKANVRFSIFKHIEEPARNVVLFVSEASVILLAARELLVGGLDAATFILFLYLGRMIMTPLGQLATSLTQIQTMLTAAARVSELFGERPDVVDGDTVIADLDRCIEFRDVSFAYEENQPALAGISLTIRKGEVVAIVGPSGAGKSTLMDLLLRFRRRARS